MHTDHTLDRRAAVNKRKTLASVTRRCMAGLVTITLCLLCAPALAVDGCLVLLCFAAPNWRAVPQCVPPIRQVLRDLARAKAFPTCAMAGAGNSAQHSWARAPSHCPPQYTRERETTPARSRLPSTARLSPKPGGPWPGTR